MQKPSRGFLRRANVPEFEANFEKIDAFRTHKYRQFGEKDIDLTTALSEEEIDIEANGIFIKYPVKADIRINDLDAPKISALQFRYIGGYVHKIYVTSPIQNPKLKLLTGVNSEVGFMSNNYHIGDKITGSSTSGLTSPLIWYTLNYTGKTIMIRNSGDTNNLGFYIQAYIGEELTAIIEYDTGVGIPPGEKREIAIPGTYDKIRVQVIQLSASTTFEISYNGSSVYSEGLSKDSRKLIQVADETTSHTVNGESYESGIWKSAEFHMKCTSLTGTTPTLDVKIQAYDPNVDDWFDIATFTQLAAAGTQHINISEGLGWLMRVQYTTGGTVTDCDFKVGVVYKR